jgi:hypothetical protein
MSQIILVGSYCGLSSYTHDVSVTGRLLEIDEVRKLGLVDDAAMRRHKRSDYSQEWYEINPGDQVTVIVGELGEEEEMVFEIPETPLLNPPQKLDDMFDDIVEYLKKYCRRIS